MICRKSLARFFGIKILEYLWPLKTGRSVVLILEKMSKTRSRTLEKMYLMRKSSPLFISATLGMLTAFGPFVTDFYLPVLPEMAGHFHTSPTWVSMSLTCGMIGLAGGQMFIGPLTDKWGRQHILTGSMVLFALSSLLCIFSGNIVMFNVARLFQGIAGAGGIVISKSMATDWHRGRELARFMALLAAVNAVAPICAPVLGGLMSAVTNWQGIFALLLCIGLVLTLFCALLPESLPAEKRIRGRITTIYANLFRVFTNRTFTLCTCSQMLCHFTLFGYIAASPFILQQTYGLSPLHYSLCFALNAVALCSGSVVAAAFKRVETALRIAAVSMVCTTACLALCLSLGLSLAVVMVFYVLTLLGFGLIQPGLMTTAMDSERRRAGAASAIYGASAFVAGAVVSPLVTLGRMEVTSGLIMTAGAIGCLVCVLLLCRK